jgi:2-amino-4-hydroxy-6-hydroxymethyldihydropteridine diphosphokinase
LALGSNIEPERNLPRCVALLAERCQVLAISRVYETEPVGFTEQANFLNAAVLVETALEAEALKAEVLADIENRLGRIRTANKNSPRTIDVDIALFNHDVLMVGSRRIPDPEILEFGHIALPLADLAPDYLHPETGQTLAEIADQFSSDPELRLRPDIVLRS